MKTILVMIFLAAAVSGWAVPQQINYQGYLTRPDGTPLDTTVSITFILYDASIGGASVWMETHPAVIVANGLFNVSLGAVAPLTEAVLTGSDCYLSLAVGTDGEMTPRTPLQSVAYACRVGTLDGASGGSISGPVTMDTTLQTQGIRFNDGTVQFSAVDTSSLATRTWVQSMGYLCGSNNVVSATGFVGGGNSNKARGDYAVVAGGGGSAALDSNAANGTLSAIGGGRKNSALALYATVGGGISNDATGLSSTIGGGYFNDADSAYTTISGGRNNRAGGEAAMVGGGRNNRARGAYSVVAGGGGETSADSNSATGPAAAIGGGQRNFASGHAATVAGGENNTAQSEWATVGGGMSNTASNVRATVSGGYNNEATGNYSTVGGGSENEATLSWATIPGGSANRAQAGYSTVGGGLGNIASGEAATVAGGVSNIAGGTYSTVGGGQSNIADGSSAIVSGGALNEATGGLSAVGGGTHNVASGAVAVIPGGMYNRAAGNYSFAAGDSATTTGDRSFVLGTSITCAAESAFVWSDGSGPVLSIGSSRTFNVKATGGTRIWSSSDLTAGVRLNAGGSAWISVSDSSKKRNVRGLDTPDILARFSTLPLKRWEYQSEEPGVEHIGPMAQDFWNAFHLGNEPLGISTIDADGVMMAALQELAKENADLKTRLARLEAQIQAILEDK